MHLAMIYGIWSSRDLKKRGAKGECRATGRVLVRFEYCRFASNHNLDYAWHRLGHS